MIPSSASLYRFGLPDVPGDVRFSCVFCGGPAISDLEIYDECVCDVCYAKDANIRHEVDAQYRFSKEGDYWLGIAEFMEGKIKIE